MVRSGRPRTATGGDSIGNAKRIAQVYVPTFLWSMHKRIPDPDAGLTAKLKTATEQIAEGKPDVSLYTPDVGAHVRLATTQEAGF
jgi:hypothetical protein